jgi:WD40 repeat protein
MNVGSFRRNGVYVALVLALLAATVMFVRSYSGRTSFHDRLVRGVRFPEGGISSICVQETSSSIAVGAGRELSVWDSHGTRVWRYSRKEASVRSAAFCESRGQVVCTYYDGTVLVFDAATGALVRRFDTLGVNQSVANRPFPVSRDGKLVLAEDEAEGLRLWDVESATSLWVLSAPGPREQMCTALAFSNDDHYVAGARPGGPHNDPGMVSVWSLESGCELASFRGLNNVIGAVAFVPGHTHILTGAESLDVWDWTTGTVLSTLPGHVGGVTCVSVSTEGSKLLSGGLDGAVRYWDLSKQVELATWNVDSGDVPLSVRMWEASGAALAGSTYPYEGHFSKAGRLRLWVLPNVP